MHKMEFMVSSYVRVKRFYVWNKIGYKTIKEKKTSQSAWKVIQDAVAHKRALSDFNDATPWIRFFILSLDGRMIYDELQLTAMIKFILIDLLLYRPITIPASARIPPGSTIWISRLSRRMVLSIDLEDVIGTSKKVFSEVKTIIFYKLRVLRLFLLQEAWMVIIQTTTPNNGTYSD